MVTLYGAPELDSGPHTQQACNFFFVNEENALYGMVCVWWNLLQQVGLLSTLTSMYVSLSAVYVLAYSLVFERKFNRSPRRSTRSNVATMYLNKNA